MNNIDTANVLEFATATALVAYLASQGVMGAAANAIIRETAHARHQARVEATKKAAIEEAEGKIAMACALLVIDLMGVGGRDGVEGAASARYPAFAKLGSGRKQSKDGRAYMAAAQDALQSLAGEDKIVFTANSGEVFVSFSDGSGHTSADDYVVMPWAMTLAREGLRRSLGLASWFEESFMEFVDFVGSPAEWSVVVEDLTALSTYATLTEGAVYVDGWVRTKYFLHGRELEFKPVVNDEGVSFDLPGEVGVLLTSRWRGELRDFVAQLVVGNEE